MNILKKYKDLWKWRLLELKLIILMGNRVRKNHKLSRKHEVLNCSVLWMILLHIYKSYLFQIYRSDMYECPWQITTFVFHVVYITQNPTNFTCRSTLKNPQMLTPYSLRVRHKRTMSMAQVNIECTSNKTVT